MTERPASERDPQGRATRRAPILPRLTAVAVGYAAACLIAGLAILLGTALPRGLVLPQVDLAGSLAASSLFLVGLLSVFVAALAAVPVLAGVVLGEVLGIRSLFYYTIGGGLVAGVGYQLAAIQQLFPLTDLDQRTSEAILLTIAGLLGGFAYWAVAGRNAGVTRHLRD